MTLAQKSTAVLVECARFKMTQLSAFVSLNVLRKMTLEERFALTAMKHGEVTVKFIVNDAYATLKICAVQT